MEGILRHNEWEFLAAALWRKFVYRSKKNGDMSEVCV